TALHPSPRHASNDRRRREHVAEIVKLRDRECPVICGTVAIERQVFFDQGWSDERRSVIAPALRVMLQSVEEGAGFLPYAHTEAAGERRPRRIHQLGAILVPLYERGVDLCAIRDATRRISFREKHHVPETHNRRPRFVGPALLRHRPVTRPRDRGGFVLPGHRAIIESRYTTGPRRRRKSHPERHNCEPDGKASYQFVHRCSSEND